MFVSAAAMTATGRRQKSLVLTAVVVSRTLICVPSRLLIVESIASHVFAAKSENTPVPPQT